MKTITRRFAVGWFVIQVLLIAYSCHQHKTPAFLRHIGIYADGLVSDSIVIPHDSIVYEFTEEQWMELIKSDTCLKYIVGKGCLLSITPVRKNYMLLCSNFNRRYFMLFSSQGKFLDMFTDWNDSVIGSQRNVKHTEVGPVDCSSAYTMLSDTSFVVHSKINMNDTLSYDNHYFYRVDGDHFTLYKKEIKELPGVSKEARVYILCGMPAEGSRDIIEFYRIPLTDTTSIAEIERIQYEYGHTGVFVEPIMWREIFYRYHRDPKQVLLWIYKHHSEEYVWHGAFGSIIYCCERSVLPLEELREQIATITDNNARKYLDHFYDMCSKEKKERDKIINARHKNR